MNDRDAKDRLSFAIFWAMWRRDVSPPQLARAVGKGPDAVRRWRDGESAPSALDVGPLARALGVRPEYFTNPPEIPAYPFDDYAIEATPHADPGLLTFYREEARQLGIRTGDAALAATALEREDSRAAEAVPDPAPGVAPAVRRRTPRA